MNARMDSDARHAIRPRAIKRPNSWSRCADTSPARNTEDLVDFSLKGRGRGEWKSKDDFSVLKGYKEAVAICTDLQPPPGSLVFAWPGEQPAGSTRLNGEPVSWQGAELRIRQLPAEVIIGE